MSPAPDMRRMFAPHGWVAVTASVLALGCSGGGDGSTDVSRCATLSFDRALVTPTAGDVYLDQSSTTCTTVDVGVVIANLDSVWTVGFDVTYPAKWGAKP